ncbi:MAG: AAA family ATPase, partial [Rhodospirillales bacterium]|nr:AAA family ATPase [Rhodospirillales bacterium]
QAKLASAQARADALHDATNQGNPGALLSLSDQPILVAAATNLMTLENSRNQLSAEFGPDYPKIRALDAEIGQTRTVVKSQTKAALGSIQAQLDSSKAEVKQLSDDLHQLTTQAGAQSASQAQFLTLSQEADGARTIYETFLEHENDVVDRAALLEPPVQIVSHATVPSRPTFPNKPKLAIGIFIIALAAGIGAVFIKTYLSEGFEEADELQATVSVPLLASLPRVTQTDGSVANYIANAPFSRSGEAVRGLLTKLALLSVDNTRPRAVLIASAAAREGKSTLSMWLATAARQGGQSVLMIDGDHRRGNLMNGATGIAKLGLTDLLAGRASAAELIRTDPNTKIDYIPAGAAMTRPFGAEEIRHFQQALVALKQKYSLIVINSPPLLAMTDALVYGNIADQTVFICRWQQTSRTAVTTSLDRLRSYGARVAGIVVTMADDYSTLAYGGEYRKREIRLIGRLYGSGA